MPQRDNKEAQRAYMAKYWEDNKEKHAARRLVVLERLGGKCSTCSTTENLLVCNKPELSDQPKVKTANICSFSDKSLAELLPRLTLFCTAHRPNHMEKSTEDLKHGAYYAAFKRKCRCVLCLKYKGTVAEERAAKRRADGLVGKYEYRPHKKHRVPGKSYGGKRIDWARLVPAGFLKPDHKKYASVWPDEAGVVWLEVGEQLEPLYTGELTPARVIDAMQARGVWVEFDHSLAVSDAASLLGLSSDRG